MDLASKLHILFGLEGKISLHNNLLYLLGGKINYEKLKNVTRSLYHALDQVQPVTVVYTFVSILPHSGYPVDKVSHVPAKSADGLLENVFVVESNFKCHSVLPLRVQ